MKKEIWQGYALTLRELLGLAYSPVAVSCLKGPMPAGQGAGRARACRAILEAGRGTTVMIDRRHNLCFGAGWHLGFYRPANARAEEAARRFVVEGEKLFCSYEALDRLMQGLGPVPDHRDSYLVLAPMAEADNVPAVVIFIVDPEAASRLLALAMFKDGRMPQLKIGGPTCRLSISYPLASGEINISLFDHTSRRLARAPRDTLLVSLPYAYLPSVIDAIDGCSAGKAPVAGPSISRRAKPSVS